MKKDDLRPDAKIENRARRLKRASSLFISSNSLEIEDSIAESAEQNERHRKAVDTQFEADFVRQPSGFIDKLESRRRRIECFPCNDRQHEGCHGGEQCGPANVAQTRFAFAIGQKDQRRTDQRQHNQAKKKMVHECAPANIYQVITSARPINMAKA